jgi:hypothetical protein
MALRLAVMLLMASWSPVGAQPLDDALAAVRREDAASAMKRNARWWRRAMPWCNSTSVLCMTITAA